MAKIKVSGIEGLEGEYELVEPPYTTKEWRSIKQQTGLMPLDFEEHSLKGDPDVSAAIMWITLTRAGKEPRFVWTALDGADMFSADTFSDVPDDQEEEAEQPVPPALTPPSIDGGNETDSEDAPERSGTTSAKPLALLENAPSPTGFPRSDTGAA